MITIFAALIASSGVALGGYLQNRNVRRDFGELHDSLRTNHGKRPGEYLESVDVVIELLADHTAQDERNFERLRSETQAIAEKLSRETAKIAADLAAR